jgi:hypothetical protein
MQRGVPGTGILVTPSVMVVHVMTNEHNASLSSVIFVPQLFCLQILIMS